jgi:hypothetical protein
MKENVFGGAVEVEDFVCESWSDVTFNEVQLMFHA